MLPSCPLPFLRRPSLSHFSSSVKGQSIPCLLTAMKRPRKHLPAAHYVRCFAVTNEQPIHSLQTSWSAGQVQMGVLGTQSGLPGASKVRSELSSEQKRTAPRGGAGEWGCAWMRKQPLRRLRWECPWRLQANRTCGRSALVFSRGSGDKWAGKIEQE